MSEKKFKPALFAEQYCLLRLIAKGGMAEVFVAATKENPERQHWLVIKRLLPIYREEPRFISMLSAEAKLGILLDHPNIARIQDLGTAAGDFFIAMEWVDGQSLDRIIKKLQVKKLRLPQSITAKIIGDIAAALDYAHQATDANGRALQLVHCDVTPGNVLIGYDGTVKLTDFGIATAVKDKLGKNQTHFGKLPYMAPEQLKQTALDHRADLYSLAVIGYELLGGQKPYDATSAILLQEKILEGKLPLLSNIDKKIPGSLNARFAEFLALNREQRPNRAHTIAQALHDSIRLASDDELADWLKKFFADEHERETGDYAEVSAQMAQLLAELNAPSGSTSLEPNEPQEATVFIGKEDPQTQVTGARFKQSLYQGQSSDPTPDPQQSSDSAVPNQPVRSGELIPAGWVPKIAVIGQIQLKSKPMAGLEPSDPQFVASDPSLELVAREEVKPQEVNIERLEPPKRQQSRPVYKKFGQKFWPSMGSVAIVVLIALAWVAWREWQKSQPIKTNQSDHTSYLRPTFLFFLYVEKFENPSAENFIKRFLTPAKGKISAMNLTTPKDFMAEQYRQFNRKNKFQLTLIPRGPITVTVKAPTSNPWFNPQRLYQYFEDQLSRQPSLAVEADGISLKSGQFALHLYFYHKQEGTFFNYPLEYFGYRRRQTGVVFVPMDKENLELSVFNIIHEICHLLGARDKFKSTGQPIFPEGFVEPEAQPLFPQRYAEIMGRSIPLSHDNTEAVINLSQVRIGKTTALEMGWLQND